MKNNFVFFCIFLLAFALRIFQIDKYPVKNETMDEYFWTMLGSSLLKTGVPTSWSYFDYKNVNYISIDNQSFPIVSPNLDHPPLFSLILGVVQNLYSEKPFNLAPIQLLRLPMVAIGMMNLFLFYRLTKKYFSDKWHILTVLLYAITPTVVFGSRLIVADNLLITFFLIFSALTVLTKLPSVALPAAAVTLSFLNKDKHFRYIILGTFLALFLLLLYASNYGFADFLNLQMQQSSNRQPGFASFFEQFLLKPKIVNTVFLDGVILLGTMGLFLMTFFEKSKKYFSLILFSVIYIAAMSFMSGETTRVYHGAITGPSLYGWYKFPLFPAIIIGAVYLIQSVYESKNKIGFLLIQLFLFANWRLFFLHLNQIDPVTGLSPLFVRGSILLLLLSVFLPKRLWRFYYVIFLALTILFSIGTIIFIKPGTVFADQYYLVNF